VPPEYAALKADGSIKVWGSSYPRGPDAPSDSGYTKIYSTGYAFAALKAEFGSPHTVIEPSALTAAKAPPVE
jgi:hypothetical protein